MYSVYHLIYYKNLGFETFDEIQQYINNVKKENAKNEEEEKMKLRNSTINANKEYDEKLVAMEEEKLRKEIGMKKKKFSQVKNYIFLEIKQMCQCVILNSSIWDKQYKKNR